MLPPTPSRSAEGRPRSEGASGEGRGIRDEGRGEKWDQCNHRPVPRPRNWVTLVNEVQTEGEWQALRTSVQPARPFGKEPWQQQTAEHLALEFTLYPFLPSGFAGCVSIHGFPRHAQCNRRTPKHAPLFVCLCSGGLRWLPSSPPSIGQQAEGTNSEEDEGGGFGEWGKATHDEHFVA